MRRWCILGLAITVILTGCSSTKGSSSSTQTIDEKAVVEESKEETSILNKLQVREDILTAMEAAGRLSGRNFAVSENGEFYFESRKCANYAYAYYGMPVSSIYSSDSESSILAVMEDGSVYNGTTLLVGDDCVCDVAWKTHSTNIDAYMLTSDGNMYFYNPYGTNDGRDNSLEYLSADVKFTALCRAQSYPIFFGEDGNLYFPSVLYSGGSADWTGIETSGWNDVVVAACAYSDSGIRTVAAISADGTVMAQGDYAEDILAMGDLSYITMFDDVSLIAGLTTEGSLVYAGSNAGQYKDKELSGIAGVKAFGDELYASGTDGTVYRIISEGVSAFKLNETASGGNEYCLSTDGQFYMADKESESWTQTDMRSASTENRLGLLYNLELSENEYSEFAAGRGILKNMCAFSDYTKFKLQDINGDGEDELIISNGSFTYITCIYNGELSTSFSDDYLNGYYPDSQILCTAAYGAGSSRISYGSLSNGNYVMQLSKTTVIEYDADKDDFVENNRCYYYGEEELPYTDAEGETLRQDAKNAVSEAEYEELLFFLVGDESMQEFSYNDLFPCTQENFETVFFE